MDSNPAIANVYIQLKTRSLEKPFDYLIPPEFMEITRPGSVIVVPFGRQKVLGIVAALSSGSDLPDSRLAAIEDVLDYPAIPEPLIKLALWVSSYYYCSPAVALGLVLPPGGLPTLVKTVEGGRTRYVLKQASGKPKKIQTVDLVKDIDDESLERLSSARRRVIDALKADGGQAVADLCRGAGVSRSTVKAMDASGEVRIVESNVNRDTLRYYDGVDKKSETGKTAEGSPAYHELNDAQLAAFDAIVARMDSEEPVRSRQILLMGVAGAGKTEVYLRSIEEAMARGGSAIVLVPEISLTHQAVKRFRRRFGEKVGIVHSGLSPGERYDEYMRIRSGDVGVVIGPRSALFAPLPNLRLIVIDEENDSSFKQENDPRYDARRTAIERARLEGASLVLGSATPRLESYHQVVDRFVLTERATGASMPDVEIIDMRDERDHVFSRRLISELDHTLAAGEKAILLLNSRGYANYLQCAQCGHVWVCTNCEVSLTIHSRDHRLLCHHCGYGEDVPAVCPECQAADLRRWGVGTQRLEDELRGRFPEATIFRLDADSARGYGEGPRILEEFGRAKSAILLGTQMVAKGHHFPEVTLSAVINADLALRFPEFRAEENTFALLVQLAGRSGRAAIHGRVLIQTWNAEIECIRMAAQQALDEFYQAELDRRRRLGYPPFVNLINIVCLSRKSETPVQAAGFLRDKLEPVMSDEEVLGPADLFRMQGWSRSHILVKTKDVERTLAAFKPVLEHYREPFHTRGVRIVVDVDPQWLF